MAATLDRPGGPCEYPPMADHASGANSRRAEPSRRARQPMPVMAATAVSAHPGVDADPVWVITGRVQGCTAAESAAYARTSAPRTRGSSGLSSRQPSLTH
jgi:hypothetical protein